MATAPLQVCMVSSVISTARFGCVIQGDVPIKSIALLLTWLGHFISSTSQRLKKKGTQQVTREYQNHFKVLNFHKECLRLAQYQLGCSTGASNSCSWFPILRESHISIILVNDHRIFTKLGNMAIMSPSTVYIRKVLLGIKIYQYQNRAGRDRRKYQFDYIKAH